MNRIFSGTQQVEEDIDSVQSNILVLDQTPIGMSQAGEDVLDQADTGPTSVQQCNSSPNKGGSQMNSQCLGLECTPKGKHPFQKNCGVSSLGDNVSKKPRKSFLDHFVEENLPSKEERQKKEEHDQFVECSHLQMQEKMTEATVGLTKGIMGGFQRKGGLNDQCLVDLEIKQTELDIKMKTFDYQQKQASALAFDRAQMIWDFIASGLSLQDAMATTKELLGSREPELAEQSPGQFILGCRCPVVTDQCRFKLVISRWQRSNNWSRITYLVALPNENV